MKDDVLHRPKVMERTHEQEMQCVDDAAKLYLNMSGQEFLKRWTAGEFRGDPDEMPGLFTVLSYIPEMYR